jgi:hypothetical protein
MGIGGQAAARKARRRLRHSREAEQSGGVLQGIMDDASSIASEDTVDALLIRWG